MAVLVQVADPQARCKRLNGDIACPPFQVFVLVVPPVELDTFAAGTKFKPKTSSNWGCRRSFPERVLTNSESHLDPTTDSAAPLTALLTYPSSGWAASSSAGSFLQASRNFGHITLEFPNRIPSVLPPPAIRRPHGGESGEVAGKGKHSHKGMRNAGSSKAQPAAV